MLFTMRHHHKLRGANEEHVEAEDFEEATRIAMAYCDQHGLKLLGVRRMAVADASFLKKKSEPATGHTLKGEPPA